MGAATDFSVKVLFRSHVIMGRLRRSLYVGRRIEYLSLDCLGAILIAEMQNGERATAIEVVVRLRDRGGDRVQSFDPNKSH